MKILPIICSVLLIALVQPTGALAHGGNPDFKSEINSITPSSAADGLSMVVQDFDSHLELTNHTGKDVVVKGYDGEPYIRLLASGTVEVNLNSPAYYLNEDRYADVEVPARADAKAKPDWKEVSDTGQYVWHDHRSHYMGLGTPTQVKDESKRTKIFDYKIPMTVGGEPVEANGTLIWVGKDNGFPFLPFLLLIVIGLPVGVFLARRRRNLDRGDGEDGGSTGTTAGTGLDEPGPASSDGKEAW